MTSVPDARAPGRIVHVGDGVAWLRAAALAADHAVVTSLPDHSEVPAAEQAQAHVLWHKIVCRVPPGTTTFGRPAYAHLVCVSRGLLLEPGQSSPDVLPRLGQMTWPRAMGQDACELVASFLLAHTRCRTVANPFCGVGTMLAVANARGLDAVGVERSPRRAERARRLALHRATGELHG
jgi:hypothetical protein